MTILIRELFQQHDGCMSVHRPLLSTFKSTFNRSQCTHTAADRHHGLLEHAVLSCVMRA